jgi:hypothetical protein
MNMPALFDIVGLRYRLLWAKVRLKRGRVVLLVGAYFLVLPLLIVLFTGGVGSARAAVSSGKAELVAEIVLGCVYLDAILIAILLGSGTSPAFADSELRRYPLSRLERAGARELTAFLEPVWLFVLAIDLGVAVGLHAFLSASSLWLAVPAAFLLVVTNFLLARIVSVLVDWVASRRVGSLLVAILLSLGIATPPMFQNLMRSAPLWKNRLFPLASGWLKFTPPFVAAGIMTEASALAALYRLLALLLWCFLFAALLALSGRLPSATPTVAGVRVPWDGPCDRIARPFGSSAPLVSKTLRYYLRCNRVRTFFLVTLLMFLSLLLLHVNPRHADMGLVVAIGMLPLVGWCGAAGMGANAFGFDGPGFRRYFLSPASPSSVLRVASLVPLCLSALLIPLALLCCRHLLVGPADYVVWAMLVSSGLGGLFFLNALAIWTSLLAPGKSDITAAFARDTTGSRVVIFAGIVPLFLSMALGGMLGPATLLRYRWVLPVMMVAAACFYFVTLGVGARVLSERRERILSMVERGY